MKHEQTAAAGKRRLILVAEDDPAAASVLETLLRLTGYDVLVAREGAEALSALDARPAPDLLLLDWMLPEMSGLEICRVARERWDPVALPILMVTARTDPESIAGAFQAGANDYLTKPFLGSELRARIAAQLRIKELVEERRRTDELLMDREKLSALGVLVSSVAHDLNNPLGGIMGHTQLLLHDEADPERTAPLLEILSEVQRCNQIIGDLLGFARRQPTERTSVDPRAVLLDTIGLRERHLRSIGVRLTVELEESPPRIRGVAHQLQQVFLNILINAEQAMRDGGDSIGVALRRAIIEDVPGARGRRGVEIEIHNNGPRIADDAIASIFDPFFTTKAADEGTGLGLAICDRIVRDHGGTIGVRSSEERTSFRILVPAEEGRD